MPDPSLTTLLLSQRPELAAALPPLFGPAPHRLPEGASHHALPLQPLAVLLGRLRPEWLPPGLHNAVDARRLAFIAGRLCAERGLAAFGHGASGVARAAGGAPAWPAGLRGSISHTHGFAYAVVCRAGGRLGIGIDSEPEASESAARDIAAQCCTPAERAALQASGRPRRLATIVFSLKESLFKAAHAEAGRFIGFDEAQVSAADEAAGRFVIAPVDGSALSALVPSTLGHVVIDPSGGVHSSVSFLG